jgi:cell pole-organizing protein PopZ
MSEQSSQEPTMEEILASIRRIISEDEPAGEAAAEEPAAAAEAEAPSPPEPEPEPEPVMAEAPPPPEPEPEPAPVQAAAPAPDPQFEEDEEDDALELTQKVETLGDLDVVANDPPPMPAPEPEPTLVSAPVAMAAASAFGQLTAAIGMPRSDRTLEDVVRELLQPLLKQWLDENLPKIVQEAVEAEVERISRARVR